jgi:hypothetical protein
MAEGDERTTVNQAQGTGEGQPGAGQQEEQKRSLALRRTAEEGAKTVRIKLAGKADAVAPEGGTVVIGNVQVELPDRESQALGFELPFEHSAALLEQFPRVYVVYKDKGR